MKARKSLKEQTEDALFYFAAIVESSEDAIISKKLDGTIASWNKAAEEMYGYTAAEAIGQSIKMIIPQELQPEEDEILNKLKHGIRIEHFETTRLRKDGKKLIVSLSISPVKDQEGNIIGAAKIARNITEQKKTEEREQFLEQASLILGKSIDYATTLKNIAKVIIPYLADYCRIVLLDDHKAIKEIAIHHKDISKRPLVAELYKAYKDRSKTTHGLGKLLQKGKTEIIPEITPQILESIKDSPDILNLIKQLELVSYMGVPIKIGTKVVGAITFSSTQKDRIYTNADVVFAEKLARRAAYAVENARLYAQSQQSLRLRDEFISVASHELRTPITSLKMYTQGLKKQLEKRGEETMVFYLGKMDNQIDKLTVLISDLLNVSRVQFGKLEFHEESFVLEDIVQDTVDNIRPTVKKHRIIIKGDGRKKVKGDQYRIGQVLTNLITNAIKYSPDSDKIIITLLPQQDGMLVTVEDFGIGIEKRHRSKLFDRFYRVSETSEKTFPGLGIGLYISQEIIKRHGGKITVNSEKGKGSQFSFFLPYSH